MPTFRITGPDGTVYRVTGPEGSTAEEALARVQGMAAPTAVQEGAGGPAAGAPVQGQPQGAAGAAGARTHDGLPARQNPDGAYSTEVSITVTDPRLNGGRPTNIPSLWGGKEVDEDTAVRNSLSSGNRYQPFGSIEEAVAAAKARSAAGGAMAPEPQPFDVPTAENRANVLPPEPPEVTAARVAEERKAEQARMEGAGWREKLNYGGTQPLRSLGQNVRQLSGQDVTREVERSRGAMQGAGVPGMVGNVASGIAMLGAPAGAAQSAIATGLGKVVPKLPAALRAFLGAGGSAAAVEGLTSPTGADETRGGNMAMAGATAGVLDAGLRAGGKAVTGLFTPNADANKLIADGITPPLSTATNSKVGKGLGRVTEVLSTAIDESKAPSRIRADQQTVAAMVRRADPTGRLKIAPDADIRSVTAAVTDNLENEFNKVYAGKRIQVDSIFRSRARRIIDTRQGMHQESRNTAHEVVDRHFGSRGRWGAPEFNKLIAPGFDDEIAALEKSSDPMKVRAAKILREVQPTVRALRNRKMAAQGADVAWLEKLDDSYATAMRLKDASAASGQRTGTTAKNINEAVRKGSTKTQFARGDARDQDLTDTAADLVDRGRVGNPWFNMGIRGLGYGSAGMLSGGLAGPAALWGASRGVQSEAGHKFLLGQYGKQQALADGIRRFAPGGAAWQQSFDTE